MTIGINAAAAIKQPRTGVEEYAYQLIKHLTMLPEARQHRFLLYLPSVVPQGGTKDGLPGTNTRIGTNDANKEYFDFPLSPNFEIKILRWPLPFLWTQIRLAWDLLWHKPDALFVPAHILPLGAPANSTVAIHGLEYEHFPEYYSLWRRLYLRWSTKQAAKRAKNIIAVSENTKKDLMKLYGVKTEKIEVVHHGIGFCHSDPAVAGEESRPNGRPGIRQRSLAALGMTVIKKPYILYLGRLETKKNVQGILEAYKTLKEQYKIPHELVLAGARGFGYERLKAISCKIKAVELGYVDDSAKWQLLSGADIFLFPSFYEGFGLPVLEAQAAGAPVVTSANSCLPEIAGAGALFVNPRNPAQIAEAVKSLIDDNGLRDKLKQSGFENIKRFSWGECAKRTLAVIIKL